MKLVSATGTGIGIDVTSVAAYFAALLILLFAGVLLFRIFKVPAKVLAKLLLNSILGGLALFAASIAGELVGLTVAVNIFNAAFVGALGIPGFITVLILQNIL